MTHDLKQHGRARIRKAQNKPIEWADYDRIEPGTYDAYCCFAQRYRDPGFKRWTCLLKFDVLSPSQQPIARIAMWFNLGPGEKPRAGRRGNYFPEWVRAKGGPPARGDRLSPLVFLHRIAVVEVGDTDSPVPYSVVKKIVEWKTGASGFVKQSCSHIVKDGIA